ncbi:putative ribonuclease H-like domain-containing protein [Tanacetum coccineum]|uniref:Ribonuclease H-like domain-containing protein n=1 Tax=Tanacetum coccineum TaxID=301880 RepID=A0ABQ5B6K5_9ASTR
MLDLEDRRREKRGKKEWKEVGNTKAMRVNSGMSSNSKVGLRYGIKSNNEFQAIEKNDRTVFNCTEEDFVEKPLYNRFSKTDNLKGVPHPLTGDYTPKPQQEIDESLSFGNPSEHSVEFESEIISVPKEVSESKSVTTNEKVMSEPKPKEVEPSLWNNANRVNHANHFVPRPVQLNAVRPNSNSVRPNVNTGRANVNSVRQNVNSVRSNVNTVRPKQPVPTSNSNSFSPVRPQVNKFNQRSNFSKSHSPVRRPIVRNTTKMPYSHAVKGNWGTAVKTSAGYNWRNTRPNSNCNSGSNFVQTVNAKGSTTQNKMPDENQILLKVPRQHNMYSFDMKTPAPTKDYACLIAKATSDESKLWHRRKKKPNVKGVGYRWMFDIDYLTDSMNYIPVSLENQTNPHAGTSEVTNNIGTLQTPNANASEEEDEAEELIVVPTVVKHTAVKVRPRKYSTNSKAEEFFIELQNLKTQEKEAYPTGISEDTPEILAFRRELDELAQKHLREVPKNKATSTNSVNSEDFSDEASYDDQDSQLTPQSQILVILSHLSTSSRVQINIQSTSTCKLCSKAAEKRNNHKDQHIVVCLLLLQRNLKNCLNSKNDSWVELCKRVFQFRLQQVMDSSQTTLWSKVAKVTDRKRVIDYDRFFLLWRGTIDKTLFIKKDKKDIMLVQVYVDDIIFGSTRKSWCDEFEALMKGRFQMSSMGELIFFLGLQVKQKTDGIFISQDKYVADMLKKFDLASVKTAITPMETKMALTKDEEADDVDVTPKTSHLNAVKRIFKYLKGKPNLGLWYPRESPFDLEAYSDSDYAGANLDRKSTTGGCQFLKTIISWQWQETN